MRKLRLGIVMLMGLLAAAGQATAWASGSDLPAPDYARPESWLAFPGHLEEAADTPAGLEQGREQDADVFFIHPTSYFSLFSPNAQYDEGGRTEAILENGVLKFQASVFNDCCRIYAPHYRQAALTKIIGISDASVKAAGLAYSDVLRAFDYYIAHENKGRPFIIASHSQGSTHAIRLLQERIIGTPLQKRMVAAYVIGGSLPQAIEQKGLPLCRSATMTGCVLTWNSVRVGKNDERRKQKSIVWWDGQYQAVNGRPLVCVNPLTWTVNGSADAASNPGSVYSGGNGNPIPAPVAHVTGASCEDTLLGVNIREDERRHFSDVLTLSGIYHDFDYALFYVSIRDNVRARIHKFLKNPG